MVDLLEYEGVTQHILVEIALHVIDGAVAWCERLPQGAAPFVLDNQERPTPGVVGVVTNLVFCVIGKKRAIAISTACCQATPG